MVELVRFGAPEHGTMNYGFQVTFFFFFWKNILKSVGSIVFKRPYFSFRINLLYMYLFRQSE